MEIKCTLCNERLESYRDNAYFDRGLSNKLFICGKCYKHKVKLLDCNLGEDKVKESIKYMEKQMEEKVSEIRNVVTGWIDGEYNNYFPEMNDLVYFVEGPKAYLFVFEDRAVVLSSTVNNPYEVNNYEARILFNNGEENGDLVQFDDRNEKLSDSEKLKYRVAHNKIVMKSFCEEMSYRMELRKSGLYNGNIKKYVLENSSVVSIEKAFNEYGKLNFNYRSYNEHAEFTFEFFYHQNQLMEEIYNYILGQTSRKRKGENAEMPKQATETRRRRGTTEIKESGNGSFSLADELNKLKGLIDCGVLTQEEFDEAKKKLLAKL